MHSRTKPAPSWALRLAITASALVSAGCWWGFFTLYWPYRLHFSESDRFLDAATGVVYRAQSGALVMPALAFMVLALCLLAYSRIRLRPPAP